MQAKLEDSGTRVSDLGRHLVRLQVASQLDTDSRHEYLAMPYCSLPTPVLCQDICFVKTALFAAANACKQSRM